MKHLRVSVVVVAALGALVWLTGSAHPADSAQTTTAGSPSLPTPPFGPPRELVLYARYPEAITAGQAILGRTDLSHADLRGARLTDAVATRGIFVMADLTGASLERARLNDANLEGAVLVGADLRRADLYQARFVMADMRGIDLRGADLAYADLSDPGIERVLVEHQRSPNMRGIRQILNRHANPGVRFVKRDYLNEEAWQRGFALLAKHGLSFDLQLYWPQMADAARVARANPDTQIVLNHTGMPLERDPDGLTGWRRGMSPFPRAPISRSTMTRTATRCSAPACRRCSGSRKRRASPTAAPPCASSSCRRPGALWR